MNPTKNGFINLVKRRDTKNMKTLKEVKKAIETRDPVFIHLQDLENIQSIAIDFMFNAIDANDVVSFETCFKLWIDTTKEIYKNPFNGIGHALCDEIMQFASRHGIA